MINVDLHFIWHCIFIHSLNDKINTWWPGVNFIGCFPFFVVFCSCNLIASNFKCKSAKCHKIGLLCFILQRLIAKIWFDRNPFWSFVHYSHFCQKRMRMRQHMPNIKFCMISYSVWYHTLVLFNLIEKVWY